MNPWWQNVWLRRGLLALVAVALCVALVPLTGFRFLEDDSVLYGQMAGKLAGQPFSQWMTPQWPSGRWKSGNFEEHAAVFLWPAALLGMLGLPWMEAILTANFGYLLLSTLVGAHLTRRHAGPQAAQLFAWVWLLGPGVLTYLLRGNHEPALALGVLVALWGMDRATDDWAGVTAAVLGCVWCVAIKGVVGGLIIPALLLWWLLSGRESRHLFTVVACVVGVAVFGAFYDSLYHYRTGRGFIATYLDIHLGYAREKERGTAGAKLVNLGWYLAMTVWLVAPWSLVLVRSLWTRRRSGLGIPVETRVMLASTAWVVLFLSVFDRRSVRYAFATVPFMALACSGLLLENRPRLRDAVARFSRWLPEAWLATLVLATAVRIYIHNNHYRYVSTQGN